MKECINKATNNKVLAVKFTGKPKSTIQINPNSLFEYSKHYNPNEYLSHNLKAIDIMMAKPIDSICYTQVPINAHINDYIIVRIKDILNKSLIDFGNDYKTRVVKPNVFKKWFKVISPKISGNSYLVTSSHSNDTYDVPDPVEAVGASANIVKAYQGAVKHEWSFGGTFLQVIDNFK